MKVIAKITLVALGCASLVACGGDSESEKTQINIDKDLNISGEKAEDFVRGITNAVNQLNEDVQVVSARDLKALMPESIAGMTRTAYSASKKGVEGFSFSTSTATFEQDDGPGILDLSVTDIGKVRGFAQFGLEMLDVEIDEENQDGFQRTGTYKGHKSFESLANSRAGNASEMTVFVGDRLVLRAEGRNLEWDQVQDVIDGIELDKLEALIN